MIAGYNRKTAGFSFGIVTKKYVFSPKKLIIIRCKFNNNPALQETAGEIIGIPANSPATKVNPITIESVGKIKIFAKTESSDKESK